MTTRTEQEQLLHYARLFAKSELFEVVRDDNGLWTIRHHSVALTAQFNDEDTAWSHVFDLLDCMI